jgi:ribonuclease P protein component/putative membrane protein insertion efficiency factor
MRLQRRGDFETVYRTGRRKSSSRFVIFYRANGGLQSRFGSSVKKAVGNAVVRNRIRRRIREIVRRNIAEIPSGWDLVIHPRGSVAQAPFVPLTAELLGLMRNLPLAFSMCKFYPSCSHYATEAISRHGARRGLRLAAARLWRCRPGTQGGYDPVPDCGDDFVVETAVETNNEVGR